GDPSRSEPPPLRNHPAQALDEVRAFADSLVADGGTAIFSSVKMALEAAASDRRKSPARAYSVVVMTDGKNESGMSQEAFGRWYDALAAEDRGIPVYGLLFGQAERSQLEYLARLTGGRVFDARQNLALPLK